MLRACLRSLLDQAQGLPLEVTVVDNASSDGAPQMVTCEFPMVRLLANQDNVGFARANNQAARMARGQYLFFLNNDTVIPPRTLGKLSDYLDAHPEAIMVGPRLRDGAGRTQMSQRRQPTVATFLHRTFLLRWTGLFRGNYKSYRRATQETEDFRSAQHVEVLMGAALMVRRENFMQMGGWDEDFIFGGEDMELCHRANRRGRVVYLPQVEITHFGRASTRQNVAFAFTEIAIGFAQYFRKTGAGELALFAYKLVVTLDAPLQLFCKSCQYVVRRLSGRGERAQQSRTVMRGLVSFIGRGLWRFWRV
jgi:N-acetylglucosaminyl-diphospho-decaprenol L-rhamnosyltransferase